MRRITGMRLGVQMQSSSTPVNAVLTVSQASPVPPMIAKFFSKCRNCLFRTASTQTESLSCFIFFSRLNLKPKEGYLKDIILNCANTHHFTEIQIPNLSTISDCFIGNNWTSLTSPVLFSFNWQLSPMQLYIKTNHTPNHITVSVLRKTV